jgi:hypothetical protein
MDMLVKPLLTNGCLKMTFNYFKLTEILYRKPLLLASKEIFRDQCLNVYNIQPVVNDLIHTSCRSGITANKSSPVTGLKWHRGFQEVKLPRFHDNGTGWWQGCQPYAPTAFTPRKYAWYSFLLEAESTPGP